MVRGRWVRCGGAAGASPRPTGGGAGDIKRGRWWALRGGGGSKLPPYENIIRIRVTPDVSPIFTARTSMRFSGLMSMGFVRHTI